MAGQAMDREKELSERGRSNRSRHMWILEWKVLSALGVVALRFE
jgi:hypothetical protein